MKHSMFNSLPLLLRLLNNRTDPKLILKYRDVYICDLFILNDHIEFRRYADNTNPFVYEENF